jgi:uncharacterized ParB-like nuclease family protein
VRDIVKLNAMIETLKNGGSLPPILVCGEIAYSGSHRLVAWDAMGMDATTIEFSPEEIEGAMADMGLEPLYDVIDDYDNLCDTLIRNRQNN